MSVSSMTGFARVEGAESGFSWAWEIKSVNARSLDIRVRLPAGMDSIESELRSLVPKRLMRGNIFANLTLNKTSNSHDISINTDVLGNLIKIAKQFSKTHNVPLLGLDGLLSIRGVIEVKEEEETKQQKKELEDIILVGLGKALDQLVKSRYDEGENLRVSVENHLNCIEQYVGEACNIVSTQQSFFSERLLRQVKSLSDAIPALTEERLVQEATLLAVRADINEELDRLSAHIQGARELILNGSPLGRKLDFLCQEFNRETNTICSKSSNLDLTRVGLGLKASIEQMREQIQNLE
ncbi:MAG: YicC/YloC family endoribonuclease [Pseudomonadota bacterium]|nr:YicC/YloC family endoribonuclease [Pseudomonadota bacterium]